MTPPFRICKGQPGWWVWLPFLFFAVVLKPSTAISEELRAAWVVRHQMTSIASVSSMIQVAKKAGLNTLFVQVRGRGDAYYNSDLAPPGEGVDTGFDPLEACLDLARREGIQIHAWVNVYLTWYVDRAPPESHVLRSNPEWFMISSDGIDLGQPQVGEDLVSRGVEGRYMSPANPAVTGHLLAVIEEILDRYDVAGIHLDYVRYPNEHYDFGPVSQGRFWSDTEMDVPGAESEERHRRIWNRWRSDRVTAFVRSVKQLVSKMNADIALSAAVKPDPLLAYTRYGQDWVHWVNRHYIDFALPMFYTGSTEEIAADMKTVRKYIQRGHVYAGIGAWNQNRSDTMDQIEAARELRLGGFSLFSFDTIASDPSLVSALKTLSPLRSHR